jgi:hypothetical protein
MPGVTAGREEGVAVPSPVTAAEGAARSRRVHALSVLASQLRTPLRMLLAVTVMAVSGQIEITG